MSEVRWAINRIDIGNRYRTELGDISDLAASIKKLGLLHPIVVTSAGLLVAGHRRLEACRTLGWKRVPVTVVTSFEDAETMLSAERDENVCRLDMTPGEKASLGMALEALERPKAQERVAATQAKPGDRVGSGKISGPTGRRGEVRQIVGAAVGLSGTTYQRAAAVVRASEDESLSDDVRQQCIEARKDMDKTGKVVPSYNRVARLTGLNPVRAHRDPKANGGAPAKTRTYPGRAARNGLESALNTIIGISSGLAAVDVAAAGLDSDDAGRWEEELARAVSRINRIRKELRRIHG